MRQSAILWILLLSVNVLNGQHQNAIHLSGKVVDGSTAKPLSGAHLIINHELGTTTDIDGNFNIQAQPGDTVMVSFVGYQKYLVPIPDNLLDEKYFVRITLTPATVELEEITIYQWPATLEQLKQRILATNVEKSTKVVIPGSFQGPAKPVKPGLGSPVSFLYSKLSRKARRHREFLKKRQNIESNQWAGARYHADYVKEITGITDQLELQTFMEFCRFSDQYLGEVNDYDLIVAINDCYINFKSQNQ